MNLDETKQILTMANAIDARIQVNKPTLDLWAKVLHAPKYIECHAAVNLFYERYADPANRPTIDAPQIRRIIAYETERNAATGNAIDASQKAIEPEKPKYGDPLTFRERNPELWDRLFEQGRAERQNDLRQRGLI